MFSVVQAEDQVITVAKVEAEVELWKRNVLSEFLLEMIYTWGASSWWLHSGKTLVLTSIECSKCYISTSKHLLDCGINQMHFVTLSCYLVIGGKNIYNSIALYFAQIGACSLKWHLQLIWEQSCIQIKPSFCQIHVTILAGFPLCLEKAVSQKAT